MTLKKLVTFGLLWCTVSLWAQIPAGYYSTTEGKNKGELKTALYQIIGTANVLSYGSGAGATWSAFPLTDVRPDGSVWDMYSDKVYQFNGVNSVSGMNIEHSFPKSWWGGTVNQAYKDLHHLNPSDATANIQKSNWTMGVVDGELLFDNGVIKRGRSFLRDPLNSIIVWEPADEYKGDFARIYMYMVTCYEQFSPNDTWTSDASMQLNVNNHDTYPLFQDWAANLLLAWHRADPVSAKELHRNEEVYKIQGNRNPFIDCPVLAEYIWGTKKDELFTPALISGQPYLTAPITGKSLAFTPDTIGFAQFVTIPIQGKSVTKTLKAKVAGSAASKFTLSRTSFTAAEVLSGTSLVVTYNSSIMASDTVELQLYSDEILDTVRVQLTAQAFDSFSLLDPIIGSDRFTINWNPSADASSYKVSVFTMSHAGEKAWINQFNEDFISSPNLPSGWTSTGYIVTNQLSEVRLSSSGTAGSITSSSVTVVGDSIQLLVRAKQYNTDNGAKLTVACNDVTVATFTTGTTYQTFVLKLAASAYSTVTFKLSAIINKRVIIDAVQLDFQQSVESSVLLPTYPKQATLLHHEVLNLAKGQTYYYTVQPQGGANNTVYGPEQVVTNGSATGVNTSFESPFKCSVTANGFWLENLEPNTNVSLVDAVGRVCYTTSHTDGSTLHIPWLAKGVFFLRVNNQMPIKLIKQG